MSWLSMLMTYRKHGRLQNHVSNEKHGMLMEKPCFDILSCHSNFLLKLSTLPVGSGMLPYYEKYLCKILRSEGSCFFCLEALEQGSIKKGNQVRA